MTLNQMLFGVFPYVAIVVAIVGSIWRYVRNEFSYSSLSSQFLENRQLFWGSVFWHYGVLFVLAGHLIGFLIPRSVLAWNGVPWRLYVLEASALAFGLMTLFGIILLIARRGTNSRIRVVTSRMDVVLLIVLLMDSYLLSLGVLLVCGICRTLPGVDPQAQSRYFIGKQPAFCGAGAHH
jgi:nitrate reductase gamma subunit